MLFQNRTAAAYRSCIGGQAPIDIRSIRVHSWSKTSAQSYDGDPAKAGQAGRSSGGATAVLSVERFSVFLPHQYFSR